MLLQILLSLHGPPTPAGLAGQAMRAVEVPIYDFTRHQRSAETRRVEPADVVILEVRRRASARPACGASAGKTSQRASWSQRDSTCRTANEAPNCFRGVLDTWLVSQEHRMSWPVEGLPCVSPSAATDLELLTSKPVTHLCSASVSALSGRTLVSSTPSLMAASVQHPPSLHGVLCAPHRTSLKVQPMAGAGKS